MPRHLIILDNSEQIQRYMGRFYGDACFCFFHIGLASSFILPWDLRWCYAGTECRVKSGLALLKPGLESHHMHRGARLVRVGVAPTAPLSLERARREMSQLFKPAFVGHLALCRPGPARQFFIRHERKKVRCSLERQR